MQRCATENGINLTMYDPGAFVGRPLEAFILAVDSTAGGAAQTFGDWASSVGDLISHGMVLLVIVGLLLMGFWLTFREPSVVVKSGT